MPEYNLHAAIKRLAKAEWPCGDEHGKGNNALPAPAWCSRCDGTEYIIPFTKLRAGCTRCGATGSFHTHPCLRCEGRGWIPEPDVRVACWEIGGVLPRLRSEASDYIVHFNTIGKGWYWYDHRGVPQHPGWTKAESRAEAWLRAAEAWVEQNKVKHD